MTLDCHSSSIREHSTLCELYSSYPHVTDGNVLAWITPTTAPVSSPSPFQLTSNIIQPSCRHLFRAVPRETKSSPMRLITRESSNGLWHRRRSCRGGRGNQSHRYNRRNDQTLSAREERCGH